MLPSPENNLYVRISYPLQPHLPDPVLRDAKLRLEKFVKQTFWCNQQYYRAALAAIALAKRGENIDRCFIGESAGGTGQSLFSSHLAAVYSHNRAFIDPNLFHNEEENAKAARAVCSLLDHHSPGSTGNPPALPAGLTQEIHVG